MFTDGGNCSDDWVSIDGGCYRYFLPSSMNRAETCRSQGAVLTSLSTIGIYNALATYISGELIL